MSQNVLIALGEAEAALAASTGWRDNSYLQPVPPLSPAWLTAAAESQSDDIEFRLAASLASIYTPGVGPLRAHFEPTQGGVRKAGGRSWIKWSDEGDVRRRVVWGGGSLIRNLAQVVQRRIVETVQQGKQRDQDQLLFPGEGRCPAALADIHSFIARDGVDETRLENLLRGLILIDWRRAPRRRFARGRSELMPDAGYALLKLCHLPQGVVYGNQQIAVPLAPAVFHRAAAGDLSGAARLAARRLLGSGLPPAVETTTGDAARSARIAAALLFPIAGDRGSRAEREVSRVCDVQRLATAVLRPPAEASS